MSSQTALPTLLESSRHQLGKFEIQKPSLPEVSYGCTAGQPWPVMASRRPSLPEAPRRCILKKPHSREEKLLLLPHNGIRFLMNELLDAVQNMDPSLDWKWDNLNTWYDEYFYLMVQQHQDAEENVYFPWLQGKLANVRMPAKFWANPKERQHPAPMEALDVISEVIKAGRQADQSQKSGIQTRLCQVVEEMVDKMQNHLAEQEEIYPRLIKKAGCTRAEQDAFMMETIQSLTFNGNKVVLPTMIHALELSSGEEKAASFVEKLPKPDRFLYTSSWAPDFKARHQCLLRSVNKDGNSNPKASR